MKTVTEVEIEALVEIIKCTENIDRSFFPEMDRGGAELIKQAASDVGIYNSIAWFSNVMKRAIEINVSKFDTMLAEAEVERNEINQMFEECSEYEKVETEEERMAENNIFFNGVESDKNEKGQAMKQDSRYVVTRDAAYVVAIAQLTMTCIAETKTERSIGKQDLMYSLSKLMPKHIENEKDEANAAYIAIMAKMADLKDIEAKMLELLQPLIAVNIFNAFSSVKVYTEKKGVTFPHKHIEDLVDMIQNVGIIDLIAGRDELNW